jgi:late competence protein required for DNA uptake (superfamily II DNA/RNA helicase)
VKSAAVHSDLSRSQRKERLQALKKGRLKAVVAPTVLDEGIDVPDIDLAVVMGGSKSRRQMIQRMGPHPVAQPAQRPTGALRHRQQVRGADVAGSAEFSSR